MRRLGRGLGAVVLVSFLVVGCMSDDGGDVSESTAADLSPHAG